MSHLNDTDGELHRFRKRIMALAVFVLFCFFLLLLRFVWLQIVRHSNYAAQADENRISIVPTMPARGTITDRNGVVLADNYSAYTLEITPAAKDFVASKGYDVQFGARPLKRAIQKYLEDEMAELIIRASVGEGDTMIVDFDPETQRVISSVRKKEAE